MDDGFWVIGSRLFHWIGPSRAPAYLNPKAVGKTERPKLRHTEKRFMGLPSGGPFSNGGKIRKSLPGNALGKHRRVWKIMGVPATDLGQD